MINQQMHIHIYVQSHIIILHQHVSVTPVAAIRVSYNKNTISEQIISQSFDKTSLCYTSLSVAPLTVVIYQIILSLRYSKTECVCVVHWMYVVDSYPVTKIA
jgi:hypothetical protein